MAGFWTMTSSSSASVLVRSAVLQPLRFFRRLVHFPDSEIVRHCRLLPPWRADSGHVHGRRQDAPSLSRPSGSLAGFRRMRRGGPPGHPQKCHEMSCSVMRCHVSPPPRPSPPASPKRRPSASCMSFLLPLPFRSRRRRLACGASLFRAYRMCAPARVRAGAVCAPDCAREPSAGRTSPVRSVGGFSHRREAGDEAASGCRFLLTHLTTDFTGVKPFTRNYFIIQEQSSASGRRHPGVS